jgi:hypothetical protein
LSGLNNFISLLRLNFYAIIDIANSNITNSSI